MSAVVYLDSYFFMNMVLNMMLLFLVQRIRKLSRNVFRIFCASVFGAVFACLMLVYPPNGFLLSWLFTYPVMGGGMIFLAFGYHGYREFLGHLGWFLVITIGIGGVVQYLTEQYVSVISAGDNRQEDEAGAGNIVSAAFLGCLLVVIFYKKCNAGLKKKSYICKVKIFLEGKTAEVTGYLDSGNLLKDPVSGKTVAILEKEVFLQLFESGEKEMMEKCLSGGRAYWESAGHYLGRMRLIPYQSIGKMRGFLNGFVIDRMEINTGGEPVISIRPVIAVYSEKLSSDGSYQMILPT